MKKQRKLTTQPDFQRMIIFQQPINVYHQGVLVAEGIIIKSHTEDSATSSTGEKYLKSTCMFIRE